MKKQINLLLAAFLIVACASAQIDRSQAPKSGPTPKINLEKPYSFTMENGMKVLVVEDHKLPEVNISLSIDNPPIIEGEDAGVQSLTGSLLGKGSKKTSKEDFNEEVDYLGASLSIGSSGAYASALSKYKERIMELLAEAALQPNFTQEELEFEKKQLKESIRSGDNSAAAIAGRVRSALAYGKNHPAGEFATEETIDNVTLQDIKNFYRNYFAPGNAYLVISGDIKEKEAKKLVKNNFSLWKAGNAPKFNIPDVNDVQYTQINFIDVPSAVQTELAVMNIVDLEMKDDDYHAALITNYILGGAFGSYLNMNLREDKGYTYGARSTLPANKDFNTAFRATAKVRNEVTDSAVVEVLKEMERIRKEPVDQEMIDNAKAKFLGNFIMQSEDKEVVARRQVNIMTNNLPEDFYEKFIENINAVTQEDIMRVAQEYFEPDNARIVLVGKAQDVLPNLKKLKRNGKPIPIFYFDKYATKTDEPKTQSVPSDVTTQSVLNDYISAVGGREALDNIKTLTYTATSDTQMGELKLQEKRTRNDKYMMAISAGGREVMRQTYNNEEGKISQMGQTQNLEGEQLEALKSQAAFYPEAYGSKDAKLNGMETINGEEAYAVKWTDSKTNYYSKSSGLLIATKTVQSTPQGSSSNMIEFGNYKAVKGLKVPMTITISAMGQNIDLTVDEYKVNEGVTGKDFE